ncbi:MAG TPA: efflux RND transporter periplasmic adaptor subunit [Rhodanobacteraceae bacterium]|nr:efflux RND transporter periplasmic adaptor subunit [Rhodanobacteraceae bacterium]
MNARVTISLLALACTALGACSKSAAPPAPPVPQVEVIHVHAQAVPVAHELVGRLAPTQVAEVRARVPGIVEERVYDEGSDVEQGDVLFRIDPAQLKATVRMKEAALAAAKATAHNDAVTASRAEKLADRGVISRQDLDNAKAKAASSAAAVKQAQAALAAARLDLSYATVTAPISGRAGRALVTKGALVGQGSATELTTIKQIDPIYVDFSQPLEEVQNLQQQQAQGRLQVRQKSSMPVKLKLANGTIYPHAGTVDFSDMAVDPQTGAVSLRASFPNPQRVLLPGMFVHVLLTVGQLQQVYLVPQKAMQRDAEGTYLMLVGDDGKVARQPVETSGMRGGDWIVTSGLHEGDAVIVSGLQKVRPGAPAKATPYVPATPASAPTAPAAPAASSPAAASSGAPGAAGPAPAASSR